MAKLAYFGASARPICGVHEAPRGPVTRDSAVLLCYPGVQEYSSAHWAFRRLAAMLAREGFHVLRFDWSGTGDSWGETTDGTLETWMADVASASQELLEASGAKSTAIVGMRLGATIATLACARGLAARTLVLWEPVIRGTDYIAELEDLDARENLRLLHRVGRRRDELVGFPFAPDLRRSIARIDLHDSLPTGAQRVAVVVGEERPTFRSLCAKVLASGIDAMLIVAAEGKPAADAERRDSALLGNRSATAITNLLAEKRSEP